MCGLDGGEEFLKFFGGAFKEEDSKHLGAGFVIYIYIIFFNPITERYGILKCRLGTGQNLSGTRAGTIDRGAKTFFRKK